MTSINEIMVNFKEYEISDEFSKVIDDHGLRSNPLKIFVEHDALFISCNKCGASWSIHLCENNNGEYLDIEQIDTGDEYCMYNSENE